MKNVRKLFVIVVFAFVAVAAFSQEIKDGVLTIKDGTTEIKWSAYKDNTEITKVIIPSSVTKIEKLAFQNCANLTEIDIPSSVKTIGDAAFQNCTSLTKVTLHEGLTNFSFRLFKNTAIREITIPSSVMEFGKEVFNDCKKLAAIWVDKNSQAYNFYKDDYRLLIIGESSQNDIKPITTTTKYGDKIQNGVLYIADGTTEIKSNAYTGNDEITKVIIPSSVTKIEKLAFQNCANLTEIEIPSSVETIGEAAFQNCTSLTKVMLPEGLTKLSFRLFKGSGIPEITIPASVAEIGGEVLEECKNLTAINVTKDSQAYAVYKFDSRVVVTGESSLTDENITQTTQIASNQSEMQPTTTVTEYGDTIENGVLYIKDGTTEIKSKAYYKEKEITKVVIPSTVTKIGSQAFSECTKLIEIDIPSSVKTIGDAAFQNCTSLTKVTLPEGLTTLSFRLFKGSGIPEITIPSSIKTIDIEVLADCKKLTAIKVIRDSKAHGFYSDDPRIKVIGDFSQTAQFAKLNKTTTLSNGDRIENGVLYIKSGTTQIKNKAYYANEDIKKVVIPSTVTKIGSQAFSECVNLTEIDIPSSVKTIGDAAFQNCIWLTKVSLPEGLTKLGYRLFKNTGVKKITIPSSVTEFANEVFTDCLNLTEIEIPSATTKFGTRIFGDCKNLTSIKVDKYTNAHACFSIYPGVSFTNKRPAQTKEQWMATSEYSILDDGVLYIANGITKIHDNEFRGLTDIKEIRFLDTTTKIAGIGTSAFRGCTGLKRVVIPGNVKTIGDWAFSYCSNLEEVVFEEGVENIVVYAFVGCPKLLSVYMPKSVKKLDIENIITEKRGERIFHCWLGSEACRIVLKHNCRIDVIGIDEANRDKIDLKQISISNTTIKAGLFKDLPYERIDISDNLTQIGKNAFNDKTVLRAKRNTAADKCIRANGYYLCGVLADLNTYTKDKSKEIKEDFTRILCDDDPYWRWSTYKFNTLEPLKLEEVDDKLVITSFMLYPCTNVTVTDKNGKVLMRNKTIHPFTRTDVCDFDFITDSVENYTLTSDDAFYNKLVSGKVKWNVSFSSFIRRESTRKDASSETMCPAYLREYIPGIFDFAYTIGSAEYESRCYEAVENKTLVTDEALTVPLTREQMEKLLKQTKSWSFIFGRDNIAGTGGGGVLTMTTDFILALSRGSPSAFWHEFSHCMGWAHEQGNMCFEGRPEPYNIDWPSIGSLVYQKQYKDGTLPYVFDRYSLNTYFFSGKEVFPAGVEADVIKDDTLYIGNGMPSTGSFKNNTSFTKVVLPSTVVQINGSAFYGTMINEFTIPENIVKIGNTAFHNCTELESIIIPNGVKQVGDAAFQNCMYLSTAKIGSGMRQLNYRLFKNSGLLSITIPGNIKYIGKEAFQDCKKLKSIVIEDGVRKIDDNAFNNTALREIAIPASVTSARTSRQKMSCGLSKKVAMPKNSRLKIITLSNRIL